MLASSRSKIVVLAVPLLTLLPLVSELSQAQDIPFSEKSAVLSLHMPYQGQSPAQVSSEFGQPRRMTQIKGKSSIETWHYEYFSVYFREDQVIHSVRRHRDLFTVAAD